MEHNDTSSHSDHRTTVRKVGTDEVCPVWDEDQQAFVWAYTIHGIARELQVSVAEVRRLVHSGRLPEYRKSHQKGRRVFVLKSDLENYMGKTPTDPIAHI